MSKPKLHPFTVLLLVPDYAAHEYGKETHLQHVKAIDSKAAQEIAKSAAVADFSENAGYEIDDSQDFYVLFTAVGHHDDVTF